MRQSEQNQTGGATGGGLPCRFRCYDGGDSLSDEGRRTEPAASASAVIEGSTC